MRQNKEISIIGFREKESKLYFHCPNMQHRGVRLIRTSLGWICPEGCGYTYAVTRTVILNDPSAQAKK